MLYDSFCVVVQLVREHIDTPNDEMMGSLRGGLIPILKYIYMLPYNTLLVVHILKDVFFVVFWSLMFTMLFGVPSMPSTRQSKIIFFVKRTM
mmetsp:Transcript_9014/g.10768  ORF Transcript_9014/g.10768 Transcript_9014/m.10768 type:complete len:92 (-) Transcript_9014:34-309(-)